MDYSTITDLIKNLGFPVFVAVFLLVSHWKRDKALTKAINNNTTMIQKLFIIIEKCKKE